MARLIALDVGEARIGVAVSDSTGFLASPYTTLHVARNRQNQQHIWEAIQRVIEETGAEGLVVGLPISLDGQLHAQAEKIQSFARRLEHHITIPLTFWDERLSTVEAERLLAQRNPDAGEASGRWAATEGRRAGHAGRRHSQSKRQQRGQEIDALAAAVILQDYLDHRGITKEERQQP